MTPRLAKRMLHSRAGLVGLCCMLGVSLGMAGHWMASGFPLGSLGPAVVSAALSGFTEVLPAQQDRAAAPAPSDEDLDKIFLALNTSSADVFSDPVTGLPMSDPLSEEDELDLPGLESLEAKLAGLREPDPFSDPDGSGEGSLLQSVSNEVSCLALTIYFEARGEPDVGKLAVAHVVMNRVQDRRFPDSVCRVVQQGGEQTRYRCQFTWWCDGLSDRPRNLRMWETSQKLAQEVYWGGSEDPTQGALWYHADYVAPTWAQVYRRTSQIGRHIFYEPAQTKQELVERRS